MEVNETIRMLDLEGNSIIKDNNGQVNYKGIDALIEALKKNLTILSIMKFKSCQEVNFKELLSSLLLPREQMHIFLMNLQPTLIVNKELFVPVSSNVLF